MGETAACSPLTARCRSPPRSACAWSWGGAAAGFCWAAEAAGAGRQECEGAHVTDALIGKQRLQGGLSWPSGGEAEVTGAPGRGLPSPHAVGLAGR